MKAFVIVGIVILTSFVIFVWFEKMTSQKKKGIHHVDEHLFV